MNSPPFVLGISGASGAPYARRLLVALLQAGHDVRACMSPAAEAVFAQELGVTLDRNHFAPQDLWPSAPHPLASAPPHLGELTGQLALDDVSDLMSPIASGSYLTRGMVICPCSGGTLAAVAHGNSANLIQRAADVHLKERRTLILVPREAPLSLVHIENMRRAHLAGATILPASPGWYHGASRLEDLIDFVVARILDQLGVEQSLSPRWG